MPEELRQRAQWVVWKYEAREGDKPSKVPYNPETVAPASTSNRKTWLPFARALLSYRMASSMFCGLGYVLSADDPYTCIDLDLCRDPETGAIEEWAQTIIDRIATYTELSPSGTGVHLWLRGTKSGKGTVGQNDGHKIEIYDEKHYLTMTGHRLSGTPETIADRQAELDALYTEVFGASEVKPRSERQSRGGGGEQPSERQGESERDDEDVINWALRGVNGDRFGRLWQGDISEYDDDHSKADLALCGILAAFTCADAEQIDRLFRHSGLYRDKWERDDYRERTIATAIQGNSSDCPERSGRDTNRRRQARHVLHPYPWQGRAETPQERNRLLDRKANEAKERVRAHFASDSTTPLVIALPPGVGKTHAVAELGRDCDLAWIAERHNMFAGVPAFGNYFREIERCTAGQLPRSAATRRAGKKDRNTWPLHKGHKCAYFAQHDVTGSAFYQTGHIQTSYPQRHEAIVTDELNLSTWLPDWTVGTKAIEEARATPGTPEAVDRLLRALGEVIVKARRDRISLYGRALLDAWDHELGDTGELATLTEELARDPRWLELRPREDPWLSLDAIRHLSPVVVPHVLGALLEELPKWRDAGGRNWNGRMRISGGEHGWALYIIEPLRFPVAEGASAKPWAILDATADEAFLRRLVGGPVELACEEVDPTPHTQHLALRSGKRYGKYSMVEAVHSAEYRDGVARELRYFLRQCDPDCALREAGLVGLITHKGAEEALGDALGIPPERRGHFWGMRGSNALIDCRILLVVGTPTPNLDAAAAWARALYRDDPEPIDTETVEGDDGVKRFRDERLKGVLDHLTNAELTQCAHRNRPLRFDGRTVVTLSAATAEYLPITDEYFELPQLAEDGTPHAEAKQARDDGRLEAAYQRLLVRGEAVNVRALATEVRADGARGMSTSTVAAWLRARLEEDTPHHRVAEAA